MKLISWYIYRRWWLIMMVKNWNHNNILFPEMCDAMIKNNLLSSRYHHAIDADMRDIFDKYGSC